MQKLSEAEIRKLALRVLLNHGLESSDATIIADTIVDAELSGRSSHGLAHLPRLVEAIKKSERRSPSIVKENNYSALVDGGDNLGPIVAHFAMELAIRKASLSGIAIIGVNNREPFLHAGFYPLMAARQNMISIVLANSLSRIPPFNGIDPVFGVNPMAIGFPGDPDPIIIDFSLSRVTVSDIRAASREGKQLLRGVAIDSDGNETMDPKKALDGALLAIDEHKGNALALAVEILAGPLVNAKAGKLIKRPRGYLFIVINPEIFVILSQFKLDIATLIKEIKSSRRKAGVEELFFPGERSARNRQAGQEHGIYVSDKTLEIAQQLLT
jgi:LDH2 family malate/lactate/ureidoglycolate dehydrogenase